MCVVFQKNELTCQTFRPRHLHFYNTFIPSSVRCGVKKYQSSVRKEKKYAFVHSNGLTHLKSIISDFEMITMSSAFLTPLPLT